MTGKIEFSIKNKHIAFKFTLERNVTIITGDSGTGKTKLVNMVRDYSELGKASGVTLKCEKPCIVLGGRNWAIDLEKIQDSVVFIDESTACIRSYDFAKNIQKTNNYYVLITREPLPQLPYSVSEIKKIVKNSSKPKIAKLYDGISITEIKTFPYDLIITEDGKSGFQFFSKAVEKLQIECLPANGKTGILPLLNENKGKKILVIADAAALGSEIRELTHYQALNPGMIDLFLPESFEWLILKSSIFSGHTDVQEMLQSPVDYIESLDFFSWEQFFTHFLINESKEMARLKYKKSNLAVGYKDKANMDSIISAMEKQK